MEMSCHNLNGSTLAKIHIINIIHARNEGIPLSGLTLLYSHFDFWKKKRVAKIQEQIVIAEEIMGDTQTCVFFLFFFAKAPLFDESVPMSRM